MTHILWKPKSAKEWSNVCDLLLIRFSLLLRTTPRLIKYCLRALVSNSSAIVFIPIVTCLSQVIISSMTQKTRSMLFLIWETNETPSLLQATADIAPYPLTTSALNRISQYDNGRRILHVTNRVLTIKNLHYAMFLWTTFGQIQESQNFHYIRFGFTKVSITKSNKMASQACFIFLLANILLVAQVHASPDLTLPVNNNSVYATGGAEQPAACLPASVLDSHLADTRSCLQAAISLPEGPDPGIFHNGGADDGYKLPKIKLHGACMATVSIRGSKTDRSSWDHISYVASQMAAICVNGNFPRGTTGGVKYAGFGGNIRVTLEKTPGVGSSDGGSTNSITTS